MRKKTLLTALTLLTVLTSCMNTSNLQCDEVYISDYNCNLQPRILTIPQYPYNSAPVQRICGYPTYYYSNVYIDNSCGKTDLPTISGPRPSIYNNRPNANTTPPPPTQRPQENAPIPRRKSGE